MQKKRRFIAFWRGADTDAPQGHIHWCEVRTSQQQPQLQTRGGAESVVEILESLGQRAIVGDNQHTSRGGETISPPKTTVIIAKKTGRICAADGSE